MKIGQVCPRCNEVPDPTEVDARQGVCLPCSRERKREKRAQEKAAKVAAIDAPPDMGWVPAWRALGLPEVRT